jgi:sec-independent protein translocase protein TatA
MPVPTGFIWTPGPLELVVLLVIVMIFFGVGKLPEVGKALGSSIRAFKDAQKPGELDVTPTADDLSVEETEREKEKVQ